MRTMISNIISLPINCKIGSKGLALKSEKGNGDLFSYILKSMNLVQKKSFHGLSEPAQAESSHKEVYLESLRKALLGKGKPLNKISLNRNDLPLLKKLLCQSGFSPEDAENLLKELLQNNPRGEINLSQFFNKITEFGPPKKKVYQPIALEPAAIPYIESTLRDLGLTPKEVEHVLSGARVEGGRLDLNKFVINLKKIGHKGMPLQDKVKLDQFVKAIEEVVGRLTVSNRALSSEPAAIPYIESTLRDLGLTPKEVEHVLSGARVEGGRLDLNKFVINLKKIGHKGMPLQDKVKLDQFVKAIEEVVGRSAEFKDLTPKNHVKPVHNLAHQISKKLEGLGIQIPDKEKGEEQITVRLAKQSQLPTDVKATIDQILERVVIANEKNGSQSPLFSFSKPELTDLHSKEKLSKKGKIVEKESLLSPSKEKKSISAKNGQQKAESPFPSKDAKLFSGLDAGKGSPLSRVEQSDTGSRFRREIIEEGDAVKSETRVMDDPQHISSSTFSESINTGKQNAEPVRNFFPPHLIDQVGKQISRSLLRGERAIRLQLKPPDLGVLKVEMDIKDHILKLGIITENNSVKELLLSNVHELREALVQQGVKLERLDINISYNFGHSLADSKEGLNKGQRWGQDINEVPFMAGDDREETISWPWNIAAGDRLLDLVA